MKKQKKRTAWIICMIGLAYFILFISPNASTLGSENPQAYLHKDEYNTYPVVERILALEGDLSTIWGRLIIYQEYIYGYPFFFFSALVLLPFRLIFGQGFFERIPFNIFILRQMINVLPMIFAAGIFAYTQTKFRSIWKTVFIFLFLLTIPAVVRSNMHWWHPDSLMLLAIALTFFFLGRDDCLLGKHFYFAAAACGMAAAIKLTGFFFFLTIPVYLLIAWRKRRQRFSRVALAVVGFVLVMAVVIVLSNPFLFYAQPRAEMLAIQQEKTRELREGYAHEESEYYGTGPKNWRWTMLASYGLPRRLNYLFAAMLFGMLLKPQRRANILLAAWTIPIGIYLLWFVAPKPDHYLLPLMVPMLSGVLNTVNWLEKVYKENEGWVRIPLLAGMVTYGWILLQQVSFHLSGSTALYIPFMITDIFN